MQNIATRRRTEEGRRSTVYNLYIFITWAVVSQGNRAMQRVYTHNQGTTVR